MLDASHAVLQDAIKDYYIAHPDAKRPPEVMLGGFSQAGITAGAFAEKYGKEMNVTTLFVVGSPLGKFPDIDPSINVVAYEADGDMVTEVDSVRIMPYFTPGCQITFLQTMRQRLINSLTITRAKTTLKTTICGIKWENLCEHGPAELWLRDSLRQHWSSWLV